MPRTCIIGIGNTMMGDDAVGVRVAEEIEARDLAPSASVVSGHLAGMQLTRYLLDHDSVIFVDAIDAGEPPGSVFRFPSEQALPQFRSHTSHGMSIPDLLLAARLSGSTAAVVVYAIQVGAVGPSLDDLSPDVAAAVPDAVDMIVAEVESGRPPQPPED